jgi:transposase-like protein
MELEPEKRRRRRFDAEFKHEAARLVLDGGRTQREVARNLGVNPSQIKDWVKKYKAHGKDAFPGNGARIKAAGKAAASTKRHRRWRISGMLRRTQGLGFS